MKMIKWFDCLDFVGYSMIFAGFILFFVSVWADGWDIIRYFVTSIGLIYWGYGINHNAEKARKEFKGKK